MFTKTHSRAALLVMLIVAAVIPFITKNAYYLDVLIVAFIWSIAATGMNVLLGFTGLLNLAHAAFFGIGAYAVGILTFKQGWNFWLALPVGVVITAVLGYLFGLIAFRTRHDAFAIFTLAAGIIVTSIIQRWTDLTGGRDGLNGVPPPPPLLGLELEGSSPGFYYLALLALIVALYVVSVVVRSPTGRSFVAIRSNEDLARASGINVYAHKQRALMLSTALAGLAGGLYASYLGFLGYAITSPNQTFQILLFVIVGGIGTLTGPVIGTFVVTIALQFLQGFQQYQLLIFGPLLVLLVLFAPHGLMGLWIRSTLKSRRPRASATPAPAGKEG
ncbi:branched-chain amino acid ABC transporter permease [Deinococcus yavapaiensis]|uniref:Amino acid/amide ABC transporter membrane protein 2 (HAAT family) n=1 Tax=Deinococcus yavapaiensis KR-236 TaxID=694435 RepID=A0A318S5T2_9DEIO|nr:branched-chain amino acid ABC transporter permease [Deinococcus yavapaiensis]PYE54142.1 amino acid/amide ABC transporter membrane protein 2 (HAAT family) [Deinococcus yavapaiensis KR-236]